MTSLAATRSPSSSSTDDPAARIAALFDAHCGFVCRVLRHHGVHEAALDDAVQDVFVTAHRRWSSFEGRSSARSWLYGITRRIAFRYRRAADARARRFVPAGDDAPEGIDEPFARVHAAHSLAALLHGLDADKRAVLVLTELEGMTAPEVAETLGIPLGTAYSRLRAAWQVLGREAGREARRELLSLRPPEPSSEQRRRMWGLVAGGLVIPTDGGSTAAASSGWLAQTKWMVVGAALGAGLLGARAAVVASSRHDDVASARAEAAPGSAGRSRGPVTGVAPIEGATPSRDSGDREQAVSPSARVPAAAQAVSPSARVPAAAQAIPPSRAPSAGPRSPTVTSPSPATSPPELADPLTAELALLRRAQQAVRDEQPAAALALLDDHAQRFPHGQLVDERRAARVKALCAAGRRDDASREAQQLGRDPATACP
jgi:RNA polymerase sigma factor (sigma-70 family)